MALTKIKCKHCESEEVVKNGKRATGIQSLKCKGKTAYIKIKKNRRSKKYQKSKRDK